LHHLEHTGLSTSFIVRTVEMKLFIKLFWRFDVDRVPFVTCSSASYAERLLDQANAGDRLVYAAIKNPTRVAHNEQGRVLGMVEFACRWVRTLDVLPVEGLPPDFWDQGALLFPYAIPIVRAWKFEEPRQRLVDLLGRQLPRSAGSVAVRLDDREAEEVMRMPHEFVDLPAIELLERERHVVDEIKALRSRRGPLQVPGNRHYTVAERDFGFVYALRFARRPVWKVGNSHNPNHRLEQLNRFIPHAVTGERWEIVRTAPAASPERAYRLEQQLIDHLEAHEIGSEMFSCSEDDFGNAWDRVVVRRMQAA
jgi:hypothetical protein